MKQRQPPLTIDFIRSRLSIDMVSGLVTWVDATKHHRHLNGRPAGSLCKGRNGKDYWVIRISGIGYKRSHIVFAMKTGVWPTDQIDHKDGDSLNDNPENLRASTQTQNMWNIKHMRKESPLPMGVRKTNSGKFQARIRVNSRHISLGSFQSPKEASEEYTKARILHYGEFA